MSRSFKWIAPAAVLALLLVMSHKALAADVGTVAGTLVDKEGKAVAEAKIRIIKPMQRGGAGGAGGQRPQGQVADDQQLQPYAQPGGGGGGGGAGGAGGARPGGGGGGRQQQPPVAEGATDKEGKFSIADVPVGEYMVVVSIPEKGFARANVTVKAGETAKVELKLADRPARGQGGAGGAGGAGAGGGRRPQQ